MANLSLIDKNGKDIIEPIMWFGGDSLPVFSAEKPFFPVMQKEVLSFLVIE